MTTIGHWIDGKPYSPAAEKTSPVYDPARGEVVAQLAHATPGEVDEAVGAASRAFEDWSQVSLAKRSSILFGFRELLVAHTDELARIVSREHGKVISDAKGEIGRGLEVVEFASGIPQLLKGEYSPQAATGIDVYSFRQPLGVAVGITPFNFPAMVPLWMAPLAIACGNTFVLKPSERDPSASLFLAQLWADAGLPDGVFNVVQGDKVAVDALLTHDDVAAVSFVGSTPIARYIHATATEHGKRVQALGGAKNHAVVLGDADLDNAAENLTAAAFGAAGERCMAISVAVVEDSVADALVERLATKARAVRVRPGSDPDADMGPVITPAAKERIERLIGSAEDDGATLVVDGRGHVVDGHEDGFFVGPTVIDHVQPEHEAYREEIFGPVIDVVRVTGLEEAVDVINTNPYGNGTAIFTSSGEAARTFQRDVTVGMIGINVPIPVPVAYHSFGGWKDSLFGSSHIYGPEGVAFYTQAKVVTQRWPRTRELADRASFHFSGDSTK
ncbi:methylmalonate-semialdehyde dehydrogenase [Beutenbergia cavernae DSM 12333]|uniref:methylmalonate-semialdehyde dehydrogenase (CoA acylating) n=1 Tax=Beutenbergia cavernae (strain ATCC BAA-8 / DSM 12333 / CCUG 43141 / JCM 11478 / NBRC 16432 / NCIMB 13614 / HKI 0122) TaxID=471853 RepID=C5BYN2_BEUC1|nr:CoA-acylating methylmalonate-semialdehyde dehydrogenase [Beutenbergia cavernae]ACQ78990.1 methylmalonate-semialdehyde dehydrogenase [Beutenbergia cavernae DSM 12333]